MLRAADRQELQDNEGLSLEEVLQGMRAQDILALPGVLDALDDERRQTGELFGYELELQPHFQNEYEADADTSTRDFYLDVLSDMPKSEMLSHPRLRAALSAGLGFSVPQTDHARVASLRRTYAHCAKIMERLGHKAPAVLTTAIATGSLVLARSMLDHVLAHYGLPAKSASWKVLEKRAGAPANGDATTMARKRVQDAFHDLWAAEQLVERDESDAFGPSKDALLTSMSQALDVLGTVSDQLRALSSGAVQPAAVAASLAWRAMTSRNSDVGPN